MVRRISALLVVAACWAALTGHRAAAQTPSAAYYGGFYKFYDGQYRDAERIFQSAARGAIKTPQSRWIDSICYETAWGECYFQMGDFDSALQHYTNALELVKRFPEWMAQVRFASTIRPATANARKIVPWGASTRQSTLGFYPASVPILQGNIDQTETYRSGGIVQQANLFPICPQEIVRATTLALRRRATILGPTSTYDSLASDLVSALNRTIAQPNHWSQCWGDLERGLAMIGAGRDALAGRLIEQAITAGGEFDHPMTCVAQLELGRMALLHGSYSAASRYFEEATYSAVNYSDWGVLEEAFRYWMVTHLASNAKGFLAPINPAILWAKRNNLRQLEASLLLSAAENYAVLGQTREAADALKEATAVIGKRTMVGGWIGGRLNYLCALAAYQQHRIGEGNFRLRAAMDYMTGTRPGGKLQPPGSLWLYQIGLADDMCTTNAVTSHTASELYAEVLRDPRPADWTLDPMEAMAVLWLPNLRAYENWFETAAGHNDVKETHRAIEIADQARRHRFFASLDFGGRLESLRWILEVPADRLPQEAALQRQDMLARFPNYNRLAQQARAVGDALAKKPLVADDQAALKEQTRGLADLAALSAQREAILREIALRREPAQLVFPPVRLVAEIQKSLPDRHAVLGFFATSRRLYGFQLDNQQCNMWLVTSPTVLPQQIRTVLRAMGQYGPNKKLPVKDLSDARWKQPARGLLDRLLKGSRVDYSHPFAELAIVPDGILWYVPFEALQVATAGRQQQPLIAQVRVRYAPTVSLATPQGQPPARTGATAVIADRLFPGDKPNVARAAFDQLLAVIPNAVQVSPPPPAPTSIYRTLFRGLIVLDDLSVSDQDPYAWHPAPLDRGKGGGSLADWLSLPWGGPEVVILPGFHTAAEDALRKPRRSVPGREMYLSVCGLMASGARTILLSRWRTAGQTSFDLVREFAQELPNASPAEAWQRAVTLNCESRLNLEAEPRVERAPVDDIPKADHPFFWAGYMLVDSGVPPKPKPKPAQRGGEGKKQGKPGERQGPAKKAKE